MYVFWPLIPNIVQWIAFLSDNVRFCSGEGSLSLEPGFELPVGLTVEL